MGALDLFIRDRTVPLLLPGEQIIGCAHLRQPIKFNAFGVPQRYLHWLAAATSTRLILMRTEAGGIFGQKPQAQAGDLVIWEYDEIQGVTTGLIEGLAVHSGGQGHWFAVTAWPKAGPGNGGSPVRYDVYPEAQELSEQSTFMINYPRWLAAQVTAGAYPMPPEKRSRFAAALAVDAAQAARAQQAHDAFMQKAMPVVVRVVVACTILGLAVLSGQIARRQFTLSDDGGEATPPQYKREPVERAQRKLASVTAGNAPLDDCSGEERNRGACGLCKMHTGTYDTVVPPTPPGTVIYHVAGDNPNITYACAPVATYEAELRAAEAAFNDAKAENVVSRKHHVRVGIASAVGAVLLVGLGFWLLRWDRRRSRRARSAQPSDG